MDEPAREASSERPARTPVSVVQGMERRGRRHARWPVAAPRQEAAIAGGAIVGVSLRFAITSLLPLTVALPVGTLLVNLLGCLMIGIVQTLFLELIAVRREAQLFVAVGMLGGFTTFSTVSVETVRLIQRGAITTALLYQALSLLGGALAIFTGIAVAHTIHGQRRRGP